jgi:hypothetical protein
MAKVYRIHPSIGIARIGNSPTLYFDGPDVPDPEYVPPSGVHRDANQRIGRQGVVFRIYEYEYSDRHLYELRPNGYSSIAPLGVRQITAADADIEWQVNLANLKSFSQTSSTMRAPEPNDPGNKLISGINQSLDVVGAVFGTQVQLGTLITTNDGNLRVLGGFGRSASPSGAPISGLFSAGWYDDVSDGPVRATIRMLNSGEAPAVEPAWAIVGVPAYAQPMVPIVSLYELAHEIAIDQFGLTPPMTVSFTRDIFPLLQRPVLMQWVDPDALSGHGPGRPGNFLDAAAFALLHNNDATVGSPARQAREAVFAKLKNPNGPGGGDMPRLNGLIVTKFQYDRLRRWSVGDFADDWNGVPVQAPFNQLVPIDQPAALDQASLFKGVGGAFAPGIESGGRFADPQTFESPFRIKRTLPPGYLTATLSIPWQEDYSACGWGWWPSGRPNMVTSDGANFSNWARFAAPDTMIDAWWKLGFIVKRPLIDGRVAYLETERV